MPLVPPNLDDRTFADLLASALARVRQRAPEWTDLSPHDPGVVLLEAFAHLTDTLLYRVNRLPEKVYVELLRLIGVVQAPPVAARARLVITASAPVPRDVEVPEGTRVSAQAERGEPIVFLTSRRVVLAAGASEVEVDAEHATLVEAELLGRGTGLPSLSLSIPRAPVVAKTSDAPSLVVGVETPAAELEDRAPAREHQGKAFRLWREVESFAAVGADPHVFVVDRTAGRVTFAPRARMTGEGGLDAEPHTLGAVPEAGREIRAWYRIGGGARGNVAAGVLTRFVAPIAGLPAGVTLSVSNPAPATGGRDVETLENALVRGPVELRTLDRAVTARDFEALALRTASRDIARARALTAAEVWRHARPGTVEVLLVPALEARVAAAPEGRVSIEALEAREVEARRAAVEAVLEERRPIGARCHAKWARYKKVAVHARVVAHRGEDPVAVRARVVDRLHETINPLPSGDYAGWPFGRPLRASNVYDIVLREPGVSYVDALAFETDEVPSAVTSITVDLAQDATWFAASGPAVFRTLNDGASWERVALFSGEEVEHVRRHPEIPGLLAAAVRLPSKQSRLFVSFDAGESWSSETHTVPHVNGLAWTSRAERPVLLLATDTGLFDLAITPGAGPRGIAVDPRDPNRALAAVAASIEGPGRVSRVAVAAHGLGGVFLSRDDGASFARIGLDGEAVRVLEVQRDGARTFLWAGLASEGGGAGGGCSVWELTGSAAPSEGWQPFRAGWTGGSCYGLAFLDGELGPTVAAASHQGGVLTLDARKRDAAWAPAAVGRGLPARDNVRLFEVVRGVAARGGLVLAAGPRGVYASADAGQTFTERSSRVQREVVALPPTWLFCSGDHRVEVVSEDEIG
ncbi:putative baseplate assembly protein [Myxococcota bacterium]|nr:putative baseplate assembly protein [Myxococcota bacterium]